MARVNEAHKFTQKLERGVILEVESELTEQQLQPRVVLRGNSEIKIPKDHIVIGPIGSRDDYLTVTFTPEIQIVTGCFTGTIEDFEQELQDKTEPTSTEYAAAIMFVKILARSRRRVMV